jgi:hypothetical protein
VEFREITRKIWENAAALVNIMGIFSGDCNIRFAAFLKTDPVQFNLAPARGSVLVRIVINQDV